MVVLDGEDADVVVDVDVLLAAVLDELEDGGVGAGEALAKSWRYAADPIGNCAVIRRWAPSDASNSKYMSKATLCDVIQSYMR